MRKFPIPPDKASYTAAIGNSVIAVNTASGAPRMRRDMFGAYAAVTVQWTCGPDDYRYINAFYRIAANEGSTPFVIDLILDYPEPTEYEVYFKPDSLRLASHSGMTYIMTASLMVKPIAMTQNDSDFMYIYENFGSDFPKYEDILDRIINVELPGIL